MRVMHNETDSTANPFANREYALIQEYIRVFCSFGTDAVTPSKDLSEVLAPYSSSRIRQGLWPSTRRPMSSRTLVGLT